MTSIVSRTIDATPSDVWAVLGDGWLYGLWVTGASRIRDVDETWPAVGSSIHHSVGSWPALIDDSTTVLTSVPDRELKIQARAWPGGEATVQVTLEQQSEQTVVTITEDASRGPALLLPSPVRRVALDARNKESLLRLSYLVENRRPSTSRSSD